jgi:hypothetical protein
VRHALHDLRALPAIAGADGRAGVIGAAPALPRPAVEHHDPDEAHVRDLTADADFMWWLHQNRQRSGSAAGQIALACLAVLAGLLLGGVLMRVL